MPGSDHDAAGRFIAAKHPAASVSASASVSTAPSLRRRACGAGPIATSISHPAAAAERASLGARSYWLFSTHASGFLPVDEQPPLSRAQLEATEAQQIGIVERVARKCVRPGCASGMHTEAICRMCAASSMSARGWLASGRGTGQARYAGPGASVV